MRRTTWALGWIFPVVAVSLGWWLTNAAAQEPERFEGAPASPEQARQTVKMLDDVYKTAVVLITDKYVNDEDDFPAGSAAIALFEAIGKQGWHQVRLLDVTGDPYESSNVARDDFEKRAVEKIKSGESFVESLETQDGKRYFRAMTPVPVVMAKCVMCHPHYKDAKPGEAIGAISYRLPMAP